MLPNKQEKDIKLTRLLPFVIQIFFFLFIILPTLDSFPFWFMLLFIISEFLVFVPLLIRRFWHHTYLIWQFQVYLLVIGNIHFNFRDTFYVEPFQRTVWTLTLLISFLEILVIAGFLFKERAVKPILISLSSVTAISVVLIVAFIFREGYPAFIENDPVDFLTSEGWNAYYTETEKQSETFSLTIQEFDHEMVVEDSVFYLRSGTTSSFLVTIRNTGHTDDDYGLSVEADGDVSVAYDEGLYRLEPQISAYVNISFLSQREGSEKVRIISTSLRSGREISEDIELVTDDRGIDAYPESNFVLLEEFSVGANVQLTVRNTGDHYEEFLAMVSYPKGFRPSVDGGPNKWNYSSDSLIIPIPSNSSVNLTLNPRIIELRTGRHYINATFSSIEDPNISDTIIVVCDYRMSHLLLVTNSSKTVMSGGWTDIDIVVGSDPGSPTSIRIDDLEGLADVTLLHNGTEILTGERRAKIIIDQSGDSHLVIKVRSLAGGIEGEMIGFRITVIKGESSPEYGIAPFIVGSFILVLIALLFAVPVGLSSAIFLAEYCPKRIHDILRPLFELLAGIPSIIYGLWGYFTFGPFIERTLQLWISSTFGAFIPFLAEPASTPLNGATAFTAGLVLGIMILPIIITLSEDSIRSVSKSLKEGSLALGTTRWQTMKNVILRKARSGIISSIILAMGRAIGETMAVLMILQVVTTHPKSIFDGVGSMTGIIAGTFGWSFDLDRSRHAIFGIALVLFVIVFVLNIIVYRIQNKPKKRSALARMVERVLAEIGSMFSRTTKTNELNKVKAKVDVKRLMSRPVRAHITEYSVRVMFILASVLVAAVLFYVLGNVLTTGLSHMKLSYLTEREIAGGLQGGGFANAMFGSILLTFLALVISIPFSVGAGIYAQQYAKSSNIPARIILFASDTLASTPSIVFGAFGFIFFVIELQFRVSLIAAALTLAIMVIPFLLRATIEALKAIPKELSEASLAMGATKWQTIWNVVLPPAVGGITSGVILAIGRAIGETAAIIFTAGYAFGYADTIMAPVATMPTMIFNYYDQSSLNPDLAHKIYSAAFVLISIVLILNTIARIFQWRSNRMMKGKY